MPVIRHYFPGNNTPKGFFSYYRYIMDQKEATKILCIKGGPGTGKSTLLKRIGENFQKDYDIDYLHCSADEESLDGIIIKEKNIAIVDGTSPHCIDPITPGAVDKIINLGEYWDEEIIQHKKDEIIDLNEKTSECYKLAYNYFSCAESLYNSLETIYFKAAEANEIYRLCEDIVRKELSISEVKLYPGKVKRFFASAITASGYINYIPTLIKNINKIYMLTCPIGYSNRSFMEILKEGAVYRGLDVECYYCPMKPDENIEHLIIPELSIAFITTNRYHDIEPWQLFDEDSYNNKEIVMLDLNDYMMDYVISSKGDEIFEIVQRMDCNMNDGINYLKKAKQYHSEVEKVYSSSMNFAQLDKFVNLLILTLK